MSRRRPRNDVERTVTMLDLLHENYDSRGMSRSHVVLEEVAPGTGFSAAQRWADVLVLGVWPSAGVKLDGFEVKASKADLKRELADPGKHQALARYCDTWTLVAWDESVLVDGIPDGWGIWLTKTSDGGRELYQHRKPAKLAPEPWPRAFVCSLIRNATEQSPSAAFVARAVMEAQDRARTDWNRATKEEARRLVRPLCELLYGKDDWRWPKESRDPETVVRLALERLTQLPLTQAAS